MDLMARAWADGFDFLNTKLHRKKNVKAGRRGFGDMICEVSNLCQAPYFNDGGNILVPDLHKGFKDFISLLPVDTSHWHWEVNSSKFMNLVRKTKDWDSQNNLRTILHCHSVYNEKLGPAKVAYIISKAKFHIGIDSGMSHFALTIKNKEDVHIYVPKDRQTSVTYRWINKGYNVELI
jgi:hypothetical protein